MGTYQLGRRLVAASGVVEAHLGTTAGEWFVLSRLSPPWTQDATLLERYVTYAKLVAATGGAELTRLCEAGAGGDGFWLVEQTGDGEPLRALMASKAGRLSLNEAVAIVERLAQGLGTLHGAGLVHGDVSASSVFVNHQGGVQLLHPGLASLAGAHPSRGPARSEPHSVAPEQLAGPPGPPTDIFRLGLLLLELVTGRSLFVATDPLQVLVLAQRFRTLPPAALEGVPAPLHSVLTWMMHVDPAQRPTAEEVPNALQMAGASLDLSTGDAEIARAFRRLMADRPPPAGSRTTELRVSPPRPSAPPPPVKRAAVVTPPQAPAAVLGRIGTRRVTHEELEAARAQPLRPSPPLPAAPPPASRDHQLGEHLVRSGRLTAASLAESQARATMLNLPLADALLFDGVLEEDAVVEALGAVTRTPVVTSAQLAQLEGARAPLHLLSSSQAERFPALPLAEKGPVAVVAVVEPLDAPLLEELKAVMGRAVQAVRAGDRALRDAVTRLYGGVSDDDPDSWLDRGPDAGHTTDSGIERLATGPGVELPTEEPLELEGRAPARSRSLTVSGLDDGQTRLVEVLLGALGEAGQEGVALVQLSGELARRLNASPADIDRARFVTAAVVITNLVRRHAPWAPPAVSAFDAQWGPLALPVKGLVPVLFEPGKALPGDLVGLAVVTTFAFAQAGASSCPAPWQPVIATLRSRRFPSIALEALTRALES